MAAIGLAGGVKDKAFLVSTVDVAELRDGGSSQDGQASFGLPAQDAPSGPLLASFSYQGSASGLISKPPTGPMFHIPHQPSNVTILSKFDALSEIGTCACNPPDVQVAAGSSYLVEMVNLGGAVYTKQGSLVKSFLLEDFFGTGTDFISDPKVLYDAPSGRWFASLIDTSSTFSPTNLTIATSITSDPTGVWRIYKIVGIPGLVDQPLIGMNDDKFVISGNFFGTGNGNLNPPFLGAQYWVLNKVQLIAGSPTVDLQSFGPDPTLITAHPAQSLSSTATEWMVSNAPVGLNRETFSNNTAYVIALNGLPPHVTQTKTRFAVMIGTYTNGSIPGGNQPGTTYTINTNDIRIQDASWFQGILWFAVNDGCTPTGDTFFRSCFQLLQVNTSTLTLNQEFNVGSKGQSFFYPALRQDAFGNMILIYGFSSSAKTGGSDIYPSLAVAGQATTDKTNSLTIPKTVVAGTANETRAGPRNMTRYGDYFGAAVDPSNPSVIWTAGEYHDITKGPRCFGPCANNWSTYVASVQLSTSNSTGTPITLSDFAISSSTQSIALGQGQQLNATMTLFSVNFGATLSLAGSSRGATVTFSPSSVTLTNGGTATSTMTATGSPFSTGFDKIIVNASSGSLSHISNITLFMTPLASRVNNVTIFHGVSVNTTGLVSLDTPSSTFTVSGSLTATAKNSTTGAVLYSNTYSVPRVRFALNTTTGFYQSGFLLTQWVNPYPISSNMVVSYRAGRTGSGSGVNATIFSVSRNVDINLDGSVDQGDVGIWRAANGTSIGNPKFNPRADLDADGTVDTADLNILETYMGATDLIPTYTFTAPPIITVSAGQGGLTFLTITSNNGFAGTVTLTAAVSPNVANGPTTLFSATTLSLSAGGSATSRLAVRTTSSTPTGLYVVNVTSTSGVQAHSLFLAVTVKPSSVNVGTTQSVAGVNITSSGSLTPDTGTSNGLTVSGSVSIVAVNKTTGAQMYSYTYSLNRLPIPLVGPILPGGKSSAFSFQRNLLFEIPVTAYPLTLAIFPTWSGPNGTTLSGPSIGIADLFRNPDLNLDGTVDAHDAQVLNIESGCYIGTPCYDPRADLYATGFTGFGFLRLLFILEWSGSIVFYPYTVTANPSTLSLVVGSTGSSTINLVSQGFVGQVTLSATTTGPSASFASTSLALTAGGTNTTTANISAVVGAGNYTVTVNASNGPQVSSTTITVRISDFSVSSSQTTIVFPRGSTGNTTITVSSLNGFSGTITFAGVPTPSDPAVLFNPPSLNLNPRSSLTSTMTLSANSANRTGLYSVVLSGTSGSVVHSVTLIVAITPVQFPINDKETFIGVTVTTTGTISLDSPGNAMTISGRLTTVATNATTGALISSRNYTITHTLLTMRVSGSFTTPFVLNVTATSTPLGVGVILNISAPSSSGPGTPSQAITLSRNPDVLEQGSVTLQDFSYVNAKFGCSVGQLCYDPRADVLNHGIIDQADISLVQSYALAPNLNS